MLARRRRVRLLRLALPARGPDRSARTSCSSARSAGAGTLDATPGRATPGRSRRPETTIDSGPAQPTGRSNAIFDVLERTSRRRRSSARSTARSTAPASRRTRSPARRPGAHTLLRPRASTPRAASTRRRPPAVDGLGPPGHDPRRRRRRDPSDDTTATFDVLVRPGGRHVRVRARRGGRRRGVRSPCTSPQVYTDLIFGEHVFAVRAVDAERQRRPRRRPSSRGTSAIAAPPVDDHVGARRADRQPQRDVRVLRRRPRTSTLRVRARRRRVVAVHLAEDVHRPAARPAHLRGARARARGARRAADHDLRVDGRRPRPPETTIVFGPPDVPSDSTTATFAFESDEAERRPSSARSTSADFAPCPVPSVYTDLADGEHTLQARAVDAAGNVDADAGELHVDRRRRPHGADHDDPRRARRPTTTSIEGEHQLHLRGRRHVRVLARQRAASRRAPRRTSTATWRSATTRSASARPTRGQHRDPGSYAWTIIPDTTPPETTLHATPPLTTIDTTATFSFSSNEFDAEFECALDAETFAGCESPMEYADLASACTPSRCARSTSPGNIGSVARELHVDRRGRARHRRRPRRGS